MVQPRDCMIEGLKPYSKMKDSSPWQGMPDHWEAVPLRAIARMKSITGKEDRELLSVYLDRGVIKFSEVDEKRTNVTSEDLSKYQAVDPGDLVLNNQQAWRGSVGVSRHTGIVSPAYLVVSLNSKIGPAYANLLFRERTMVDQYLICSRGVGTIQRNLYWPSLKTVPILLPPLLEQEAIVGFVDHLERRIRRYIRAKRKLIKLLEEQKHAIVNRTVTRGLNLNVRLKPSGVEWVGDIPEHWEVMLNQRIFKENIRPHFGHTETPLSLSQRDGLIATTEMKERSLQTSTYENWKVTVPGDLVVNRFKAHLGVFFASGVRGIVSFHYGVFVPRRRMCTKYFEHLYHTQPYRTIYAGRSNGMTAGLQNLSNQNFYSVKTIVPPIAEQLAIVEYVEKATFDINTTIARTAGEIDLLREYRTRLIADVVTGKLDVRDVAARLPNKPVEPELLDDIGIEFSPDSESTDAVDEMLEPIEA